MTTARDWDRETQGQRAALALNELGAAVDAILSAAELLGVTPDGLGLGRALEDLATVLAVAYRRYTGPTHPRKNRGCEVRPLPAVTPRRPSLPHRRSG